jgi:hypothetical protein
MEWTPFAGLTALDENDPITVDGGSFLIENPRITDHFLQIGAVTHRHDGHASLPNPSAPPTGAAAATGGQLGDGDYVIAYTVLDAAGGETTPAPAITLSVGGGVGSPNIAPDATLDNTQGIMPDGDYFYAVTYTDGAGGETTIGPSTFVYVDPGFASAAVALSGLSTELTVTMQWRLWRSYEGADWHLVSQGATDTYLDAGFDPPDNPARPPEQDTTNQRASLQLTLPTAATEPAIAQGTAIKIYLAPDTTFANPCLYTQVPVASGGATLTITSDAIQEGSPPHVSTSVRGAAQINPDTDISNWYWKSPVDTAAHLPMIANNDGDARITRDTDQIWIWDNTDGIWQQWNPGGGVLASSQQSGNYTLALTDSGSVIEAMSATASTLTIPAHVVIALPVGCVIEVFQYGAGQVAITAGAGVTLRSDGNKVHTAAQYATISMRQRDIDEWVLSGDLA